MCIGNIIRKWRLKGDGHIVKVYGTIGQRMESER